MQVPVSHWPDYVSLGSLSRAVQTILNEVLQSQLEDYLPYLGGAAGALFVTGVAYWASRPTAEKPLFPLDAQALLLPVRNRSAIAVAIFFRTIRILPPKSRLENPRLFRSRADSSLRIFSSRILSPDCPFFALFSRPSRSCRFRARKA